MDPEARPSLDLAPFTRPQKGASVVHTEHRTVTRAATIAVDCSLKQSVLLSTGVSIEAVHAALGTDFVEDKVLLYYAYPFPSLGPKYRAHVSSLLQPGRSTHDGEETAHFRKLVGAWRPAFTALYAGFQKQDTRFFYYLHQDLAIMFRWVDQKQEAVISRVTAFMEETLRDDGAVILGETEAVSVLEVPSSESEEQPDDENEDPLRLRAKINTRLQARRSRRLLGRARGAYSGRIQGAQHVHVLFDYLLNQRDGHSFVVWPELFSLGPFLHGTQCRNELVVKRAVDAQSLEQVSHILLRGNILPAAVDRLLKQLSEMDVAVVSELDLRTRSLEQFVFEGR